MYFCEDVDLFAWEPGIFLEGAFGHQGILKGAAGTLTGTGLVMGAAVLGDVLPGMVMAAALADDSASQLLEVVAVADGSHATLSVLRGRASEAAVTPLVGGSVKVSVVTFRPQIAAVGDELLGLIGVASDRDSAPSPASADLKGFRMASIAGTLAATYRMLAAATNASNLVLAKKGFYEGMYASLRRTISGVVDADGDGVAETRVRGGVGVMERA